MESVKGGFLTRQEIEDTEKSLNKVNFKTGLKIFKDHNGFTNGELHTFIGTKGSGKSTWSKTILCELLYSEKRTVLYISEERREKYLLALNKIFIKGVDADKLEDFLNNVIVISEQDEKFKDISETGKYIRDVIEASKAEIFIMDNFTTSFMSELPIQIQSSTLRAFKKLADDFDIPVLMFFHTGKLYDKSKIDGDNVRGSATAVNVGSYNYVILQHKHEGVLRNFVYTEKARYHARANKKFYEVFYCSKNGIFTDCKDYHIEDYSEMIKGGKKAKRGW